MSESQKIAVNLFQRIKQHPLSLMASGIFATIIIIGTWKGVINPHLRQRRRNEAEAYAEYVFQQEQNRDKT